MWLLEICLLIVIIALIKGSTLNSRNCTQAEKIYHGTYKFLECTKSVYSYSKSHAQEKMCKYEKKLLKESDPANEKATRNCSSVRMGGFEGWVGPSGYSTSCDILRFRVQVCGSHYNMCHTPEEKKLITKMWIKQSLRETGYYIGLSPQFQKPQAIHMFEDNILELKNGKCDDILQEYFDKEEMKEISDILATPDATERPAIAMNYYLNMTIKPMGVLAAANMDGSQIPITGSSKYLTEETARIRDLTLPSHWKYCEWKLTQEYGSRFGGGREYAYSNLLYRLPDLWHCDGKCNSNQGDNQAWYLGYLGFGMSIEGKGPGFQDLEDGGYKFEEYVAGLIEDKKAENIGDKGVLGCFTDTVDQFNHTKAGDCEKYQNFVQHCLEPIDRCLGKVAIREVVLSALVPHFKPGQCWEKDTGNHLGSSLALVVLCLLFHRHMYSQY